MARTGKRLSASALQTAPLSLKGASILASILAGILTTQPALAEQIAERQLAYRAGKAMVQMRAALGSVAEGQPQLGAVLQPKVESGALPFGRFFTKATAFSAVTRPSGEKPAIVVDATRSMGLKQIYGGWSSGRLLGLLGEDAVTISFGREIVADGSGGIGWEENELGCNAECWIRRPPSEAQTTTLTVRAGAAQGRFFLVRNHEDTQIPPLAGMEARLSRGPLLLGGGIVRARDDTRLGEAGRRGFFQAGYDFSHALPWSPRLTFRYHIAPAADGRPSPLIRSIGAPDDHLPWVSAGSASELRLSLQPSPDFGVGLYYLQTCTPDLTHELKVSAEYRLSEGITWRVGGWLSVSEHKAEPLTPAGNLEATVSFSF